MPYIEERTYYPAGCDLDNTHKEYFKVGVYYRGQGKWMVAQEREGHFQLTHTGKWLDFPQKFQAMRWCRHDFETACKLAEAAVESRELYGLTWAEWESFGFDRGEASPLIRERMAQRQNA